MVEIIKGIPYWELLEQAARIAAASGWHLYLVGGVVRDLLLAQTRANQNVFLRPQPLGTHKAAQYGRETRPYNCDKTGHPYDLFVGTQRSTPVNHIFELWQDQNLSITDIDLVVDGCQQTADVGAGVKLATALQQLYPAVHLDIHGAFQTAALVWDGDPKLGCLGVDIATARTESYPYPAANPEVSPSSIRQDLYRRDFTINALAWRLTPSPDPPLLDLFGGLHDLAAKQIRVLHPNSFIDDPTRIFRGVRFAVRLGFKFEAETELYIRDAISSGVYVQTAQAHRRTPALQTRLKTELKYLLQASYWQAAFKLLADLDAFQCIHSTLKLDRELLYQLRLLGRCLDRFDRLRSIVHWQLRLELIIAHLDPIYRSTVATNLQLPPEYIHRLQALDRAETNVLSSLPNFTRVSQVVRVLKQFDRETLILIAVRCQSKHFTVNCQLSTVNYLTIRRQIWKCLTVWQQMQPILNGNDLRKLGYQPGPQYREMLDNLLMATLDGDVIDRSSAEEFLVRFSSGEPI